MLLENYSKNWNQRVVLNGISSSWKKMLAGVPLGPVLGSLLFFIYINDLPHEISSICKMFADDTSRFSKVKYSSLSLFYTVEILSLVCSVFIIQQVYHIMNKYV